MELNLIWHWLSQSEARSLFDSNVCGWGECEISGYAICCCFRAECRLTMNGCLLFMLQVYNYRECCMPQNVGVFIVDQRRINSYDLLFMYAQNSCTPHLALFSFAFSLTAHPPHRRTEKKNYRIKIPMSFGVKRHWVIARHIARNANIDHVCTILWSKTRTYNELILIQSRWIGENECFTVIVHSVHLKWKERYY